MAGKRRPSAYTQIISEQQKDPPEDQKPGDVLQSDNTITSQNDNVVKSVSDKSTSSQNDNITLPQSDIAVGSENDKSVLSQNDNAVILQDDNIAISQQEKVPLSQNDPPPFPQSNPVIPQEKKQKRTERERLTYYLDPSQVDKLEDMRTAYRRATGKRLNEQELMRLIIDRLELSMLL
jgi:hypothetical protein